MKTDQEYLDAGYEKFSAPAKINLFLKIINKRIDGYHNLQSIFHLIELQDDIFIKIRYEDTQINIINSSLLIKPENDLTFKAAQLILLNRQLGADIFINKKIPIGAGLGGGSSDAATVIMGINKLGKFNLSKISLTKISLNIGADVPFFINGGNAWVEGIGELLYNIQIPNFIFIVMVPNLSINTKNIFSEFKLTNPSIPLKIASSFDLKKHEFIDNDLEDIVIKKFLSVSLLMDWMKRFGYAKMSGSGSGIFLRPKSNIQSQEIKRLKPENIEIYAVKGLSVHPFYLTD